MTTTLVCSFHPVKACLKLVVISSVFCVILTTCSSSSSSPDIILFYFCLPVELILYDMIGLWTQAGKRFGSALLVWRLSMTSVLYASYWTIQAGEIFCSALLVLVLCMGSFLVFFPMLECWHMHYPSLSMSHFFKSMVCWRTRDITTSIKLQSLLDHQCAWSHGACPCYFGTIHKIQMELFQAMIYFYRIASSLREVVHGACTTMDVGCCPPQGEHFSSRTVRSSSLINPKSSVKCPACDLLWGLQTKPLPHDKQLCHVGELLKINYSHRNLPSSFHVHLPIRDDNMHMKWRERLVSIDW